MKMEQNVLFEIFTSFTKMLDVIQSTIKEKTVKLLINYLVTTQKQQTLHYLIFYQPHTSNEVNVCFFIYKMGYLFATQFIRSQMTTNNYFRERSLLTVFDYRIR